MTANFVKAATALGPIEGGYCKGGMACGSRASGETYKGIDRNFHKSWPGWVVIDNFKRRYGPIKHNAVIKDAQLDKLVLDFYQKNFWVGYGINNIKNQTLADLVYTYIVQRPAKGIAEFNKVARELGATRTLGSRLTPEAVMAVEANVLQGYVRVRAALIASYLRDFAKATAEKYIRNRILVFPAVISTGNQTTRPPAPLAPPANQGGGVQNLGLLFSIWKLLF